MVNYQNGKIYKIISENTKYIYIGSTAHKYLSARLRKHLENYRLWLKQKDGYTSSFCILAFDCYKIVLLENYPCNTRSELRIREQYWLDKKKKICINECAAFVRLSKKEYNKQYCKQWREKHPNYFLNRERKPKYCDICDIHISGNQFARHRRSRRHRKLDSNI